MIPDETASQSIVRVDDTAITCGPPDGPPDGHMDRVTWDDLQEVLIETKDAGLAFKEAFWILRGSGPGSVCTIAHGSDGIEALVERLQQLPGFDHDAFAAAMSSTFDGTFQCWKRQA